VTFQWRACPPLLLKGTIFVNRILRVAYFPDSFLEVDGVAMTSNKLVGFARERKYPLICVHAGPETKTTQDGSITFVSLKRSPISIPMDHSLRYDPLLQRHVGRVRRELESFRPEVVHITGLNDISITGAYLAWRMDVPLVGSWHTNLHEYAVRRLYKFLRFLPEKARSGFAKFLEQKILDGAKLYYKMPQVLLAPNQELIDMLTAGTGRQARLMIRGVDTEQFAPHKRTINDGIVRFGFVGRLRAEKNVRLLAELEERLLQSGRNNFRFLIVGEGDERRYLERRMKTADFTGFLEGEQLSEAYANMDVFVFPSETDAYGNVPQEAMASGAPAIVSDMGGPKFFVTDGINGFVAHALEDFVKYATRFLDEPELLSTMRKTSRQFALTRSWDSVFEGVYSAYAEASDYLAAVRDRQRREREVKRQSA
jgi:glycosyltransferase involved in cell wall biosynthesis